MVLGAGTCACLRVLGGSRCLSSVEHLSTRSSTSLSEGLVGKIEAGVRALSKKGLRWGRKA